MLFIHRDYPYLAATPDGLAGEEVVAEVGVYIGSSVASNMTSLEGTFAEN